MSAKDTLAVFDALTSIARSRRRMLTKKVTRSDEVHPEAECALARIDYVLDQARIARAHLAAQAADERGLDEMVRLGTAAWRDVPESWLEELRGGAAE